MIKGIRYVAPAFMLLLSTIGACFCGYSAMNCSSMVMAGISVIGIVGWLLVMWMCLSAIQKGRRLP